MSHPETHSTSSTLKPYYVTTAIDYPNGAPHIGHSLEKVAADAVARYHRLLGDDVAFTMGLDENSQHILTAALENNQSIEEWTAQLDTEFRAAWDALNISRTSWVLTSRDPRHKRASEEMFSRAQKSGDIYKSVYAGWYCPNCNNYYAEDELIDGHCPLHPTITPEFLEEENYFFRLSAYTDRLLNHVETHPEFIVPATWRPEILGLLRQGLRDFSVSRRVRADVTPWGLPVPGDPDQVLYVWFDALTTYLTGIGFMSGPETFERFWPVHTHVIGKDISRFHCLYWPAMLLSAGLPLPRQIAIHGFLTLEGRRLSKSAGHVLYPQDVVAEFGTDPVRYYLLRETNFASDSDFSRANLIRRHNDDLGNDLGNLLNRVVAMIGRYYQGNVPRATEPGPLEADLQQVSIDARLGAETAIASWSLDRALESIWTLVRRTNRYLEERQPWKIAKDPDQRASLETTLASAAEATRLIAILLAPFIPDTADRIMTQLGQSPVQPGAWRDATTWGSVPLTTVNPGSPLFPRLETEAATT